MIFFLLNWPVVFKNDCPVNFTQLKCFKKKNCGSLTSFSGTRAAPLLPLPNSHCPPQGHRSKQRQGHLVLKSCRQFLREKVAAVQHQLPLSTWNSSSLCKYLKLRKAEHSSRKWSFSYRTGAGFDPNLVSGHCMCLHFLLHGEHMQSYEMIDVCLYRYL